MDAEMLADVTAPTPVVATVKVTFVDPAATNAVGGTVTFMLFDASETTIPPEGAGDPNEIVPREVAPPVTVDGLKVRWFAVALCVN